jgi:hypothetical protein
MADPKAIAVRKASSRKMIRADGGSGTNTIMAIFLASFHYGTRCEVIKRQCGGPQIVIQLKFLGKNASTNGLPASFSPAAAGGDSGN